MKNRIKFNLASGIGLLLLLCTQTGYSQKVKIIRAKRVNEIRKILRNNLGPKDKLIELRNPTCFVAKEVLTNKMHYFIVYVYGGNECGSGGCPLYLMKLNIKNHMDIISKTLTVWTPIYILRPIVNGFHDLAVMVHGGGVIHPYNCLLKYKYQGYQNSPYNCYINSVKYGIKIISNHTLRYHSYKLYN